MAETASSCANPAPKALVRLLSLCRKPLALKEEDGMADLIDVKENRLLGRFPQALVAEACRNGLITRQGDSLKPTAEAEAFLKRARAARDEAFAVQHGERRDELMLDEGEKRKARRNLDHSPLASLARLRDQHGQAYFPPEAVEAGERLAEDFERGHMQPRITASWEPRLAQKVKGQRANAPDLKDSALAARKRVSDALMALGPDLSGVVLDVCCFHKGLENIERERQWPARSAKLMLRTALLALDRHYRPQAGRPTLPLHWGAPDYRPSTAL
ncbi:DUF6456 domain-containing protein [Rhizobium paknamense]|uniref:Sirohydrochlorin ferrochelatase n=1 Tax=Rhizobium paknamense TaxID=1206817 RepID=A0ABU0I7W3_9HYPH|nr:DUF6456 domain-containing protein [Rhizobium paknamense]MDQ0454305.1 sirohydrochlorin ferrochelatase [Rhizobium paknamense]